MAGFERDGIDWVREVVQEPELRSTEGDYTVAQFCTGTSVARGILGSGRRPGDLSGRLGEFGNAITPGTLRSALRSENDSSIRSSLGRIRRSRPGPRPISRSWRSRIPTCEPAPRYWVPEDHVEARLEFAKGWDRDWLIGWRDIARATDERTVISTVFPRVAALVTIFY